MAAEHPQPPAGYVLLFALALLAWCLPDLGDLQSALPKMLLALGALGVVLLAYRRWLPPLQPDWKGLVLLGGVLYAAFYLYTAAAVPGQLGIYVLKYVAALQLTLMVMIVVQWYCLPSPHFNWLVFSLGFLLLSSGIMPPAAPFKSLYIWLVLSFIGSFALIGIWPQLALARQVGQTLRSLYLLRLGLVLLLISLLGLTGLRLFEAADRQLNQLLTHFFMRQPTDWSGFSGQTRLRGNQEIRLSEKIALRITSPQPLGYWRGNILTFYREGDWYPEETLNRAVGDADLRRDDRSRQLMRPYRLDPGQAATERFALQVESQDHYNGILFVPGEAQVLLAPEAARIYRNQYGLLRRELFEPGHSYEVLASFQRQIRADFDAEGLKENLRIDSDIAALLRPLARAVTASGRSDLEKARLLEAWFQQNFSYSLQSGPLTPGMDPTVDFVLNRKPAWCSWFASGMVLMLRSLGIPAHLVSGWRDMEYNPLGQYWVIREKSAHDWVEVLDTRRNAWITFDPTPADQLTALQQAHTPLWLRQAYEAAQLYWQQWRSRLAQMNPRERWQWLQSQLGRIAVQPPVLLLLVLSGLLWWRRRQRSPLAQTAPTDTPLKYQGADALVTETLLQLRDWLAQRGLALPEQALADWLKAHEQQLSPDEKEALCALWQALEAVRFGPPDPLQAQRLLQLRRQLPPLKAQRPSA